MSTSGSTHSSPLLLGVETALKPGAFQNSGNWHRGIVDAEDRLMTRWHRGDPEKSWQPPRETEGGAATDAAADECRNEKEDRVARHQFD